MTSIRHGRARMRVLLIAVVISVLAACAPGPSHTEPSIGVHQDIHFEQSRIPSMVSGMHDIGLSWVRFQVLWENIQPDGPAAFNWAQYDVTFAAMRNSGIRILGVLNGTPPWARAPGCQSDGCPPASDAQFAHFAAEVARRYGAQVQAWEVWNEPNLDTAWAPGPDPTAYVDLLRTTYGPLKAADPDATVVSAGLSPAGYEEGVSFDPVGYLDLMYRAGAAGSFDALGWHPYIDPETMGSYDPGSAWSQMQDTPVSARSLMEQNGDEAKQIWATEFGVSTSPDSYSEQVQADVLTTAVRTWSSYQFAGPLIIFNYRDKASNPADRQQFYGLVHPDDAPKTVVSLLKESIRDRR